MNAIAESLVFKPLAISVAKTAGLTDVQITALEAKIKINGFESALEETYYMLSPKTQEKVIAAIRVEALKRNISVSDLFGGDLATPATGPYTGDLFSGNKESGVPTEAFTESMKAIQDATDKMLEASKIKKPIVPINNMILAKYSTEIVSISIPDSKKPPEQLRKRDIPQMHQNNRKADTVASIKIIKETAKVGSINDSLRLGWSDSTILETSDVLFESSNFILQAIGESDSEKNQIIDNFGKPQIFMFGRRPRVYMYSGMLWNNDSNNWKGEFKALYDRYLRGTKCTENGVKILLTFDRSVRMGYVLNLSVSQVADSEMAVPMNFTMFIEDEKELIDTDSLFGTVSTDVFKLVNAQAVNTTANRNGLEAAINKKFSISASNPTPPPPPPPKATVENSAPKVFIKNNPDMVAAMAKASQEQERTKRLTSAAIGLPVDFITDVETQEQRDRAVQAAVDKFDKLYGKSE